jgi:hypothetical protein
MGEIPPLQELLQTKMAYMTLKEEIQEMQWRQLPRRLGPCKTSGAYKEKRIMIFS